MAIWQYTFHVLPNEGAKVFSNGIDAIDEDGGDDAPIWRAKRIEIDFFDGIGNILPIGKSWNDKCVLYGEQESNCFEILFEDAFVISVSFRIDFRSRYEELLNVLIEFFIFNNLIVLDEHWNILPLNILTINNRILTSPQVKVYNRLSNPE